MKAFYVFFLLFISFAVAASAHNFSHKHALENKHFTLPTEIKDLAHSSFAGFNQKSGNDNILSSTYLIDKVLVYPFADSTKKYTYTYDNRGYIVTSLVENNYGGVWNNFSRVTKTNNTKGKVLTQLTEN